jgi:hypothetical protein
MMFDSDAFLCATQDCAISTVGGEAVLLHLANGTYYGLDEVGLAAWKLMDGNTTFYSLVEAMLQVFDVEKERLEADLKVFLTDMVAHQLVDVKNKTVSEIGG